jgi:hypothetical protein
MESMEELQEKCQEQGRLYGGDGERTEWRDGGRNRALSVYDGSVGPNNFASIALFEINPKYRRTNGRPYLAPKLRDYVAVYPAGNRGIGIQGRIPQSGCSALGRCGPVLTVLAVKYIDD